MNSKKEIFLININSNLNQVLKKINKLVFKTLVVVDNKNIVKGSISDGDVRRFLIKSNIKDPILKIMNKNFFFLKPNDRLPYNFFDTSDKKIIPLVNQKKKLIDIITPNNYHLFDNFKNKELVFMMAGGEGKRLMPLTKKIPKSLIKIGNITILDLILDKLSRDGFHNMTLSLNYKSQLIKRHLAKNTRQNINFNFITENKKLGTAGSLSLLKKNISDNIIVLNSDIYTNLDLNLLLNFHKINKNDISLLTHNYELEIPFGVAKIKKRLITDIEEKPTKNYQVLAGIYIINSKLLKILPKNSYLDMPDLIKLAISKKRKVSYYINYNYWIDIGTHSELERARTEIRKLI